jgi:hypothetical protein
MGDVDFYSSFSILSWQGCTSLTTVNIGNNVKNIPDYAFSGCSNLDSLTIPNSVTAIGIAAFSGCSNLTTVNFNADSCISMGSYCWQGCTFLTTVNIGNNVKRIPDYAFSGCSNLTAINIDVNNSHYISINGILYNKSQDILIQCPARKTGTLSIPNSVKTIGDYAFYSCNGLTGTLSIPDSVTTIGFRAFQNCRGLTGTLIIPNSVKTIGVLAFQGCSGFTSLIMGNSVDTIKDMAFSPYYSNTNFSSIIIHAINPPVIESNTFDIYTFKDIPVYVPCQSINAYRTDPMWGTLFTNIVVMDVKPQLCMVSVDANNHNEIIWKRDAVVRSYNIYRESPISGQYDSIANIPYDSANVWVDMSSDAKLRSYRYKVSAVDTCGNESQLSESHKTMHLQISEGINNSWNLNWTPYDGTPYSTYNIYRFTDSTLSNRERIQSMSSSGNTSYTDPSAPAGSYVYYMVEIVLDEGCDLHKSVNTIKSNIATNKLGGGVGIVGANNYSPLRVYPNPTHGQLRITNYDVSMGEIGIYDIVGQSVGAYCIRPVLEGGVCDTPLQGDVVIDISHLANGLYFLKIGNKTVKIVKQ